MKKLRRLGFDRFGWIANEMDGAPVAEGHGWRHTHYAHTEGRVVAAWTTLTIGFLQLTVVAEE